MASRKLEDLHPRLRPKAEAFKDLCAKNGVSVLIYMTYRSLEEQEELYAQGRTKPGKIVTNARGDKSDHCHRLASGKPASLAFDACPVIGKKCVWDNDELWKTMGKAAKEAGLLWGGNWKSLVDKCHFYIKL